MASLEAERIAAGHAWEKHVIERREFPGIATKQQFADLVEDIMTSPTSLFKTLSRERKAWWSPSTGAVLITDPKNIDGGTLFRPRNGRVYFDNLH